MKNSMAFGIALFTATCSTFSWAETLTLTAGHSANLSEPYQKGLEKFAEVVERETNGEVTVQIFPNNQLGNEREMIEGVLMNTLDIAVPTNGVLTNFVSELSLFDLPFLFDDRQHMYEVLDGEVGNRLASSMQENGFRLLGFYEAGVRHIVTQAPVNSIEDLDRQSIRTMQIPAHVAAFNEFGANATPLAYSELYAALESGVVDGAEAAFTNYQAQRFYEVAPYLAEVSWTTLVADLVMSEQRFQSLPENVQQALLVAGQESAEYERQVYADMDARIREELLSAGVEFTQPDLAPFRERSQAVYDEFVDTDQKQELLDEIEQLR
ncbi:MULTISPECIES: TRAP transporter substrate-binding protein [unclassified Halomonas]|uniref:TRAP transporter substrate-binding protein n=1 Tax=unclassified Halomonas TaxID=2609666 RepID=UPI0021E421FD|nr:MULTISPECIES: TRAP transporter substrate-binding protein [unclassified Halomonas]UYG00304.1 TRAP transporter substrate-binding protein [Halomonas sp. GD1P12]WNL38621.1 TRAP transporter substrate-binding protein [Halomonas sp. PAMB 3232]